MKMDTGGVISYKDIESLAELLDRNREFKRPDGQTVGYSLQEADSACPISTTAIGKTEVNPSNIPLPATVIDQQMRLPLPSESREAKKMRAKRLEPSRPKGFAIWTEEELAAAVHSRNGTASKPMEGAEEPEHTILHQERVTAQDVYFALEDSSAHRIGLLVNVMMPKQERLTDLVIEVDPLELRVSSTKYFLRAPLPRKVLAGKADAKWDSATKTLSVCLVVEESQLFV